MGYICKKNQLTSWAFASHSLLSLCNTNDEKAAKSGPSGSDGASNKNKTKCLIKKTDKGRQNSPVNLNIVLSVFARLESETQWNNEKEVKLALQSMLEMTLKPRFELEWGLATKDQQSVGLQLFDKINAGLGQKDAETNSLIESVSSKIRQGWCNLWISVLPHCIAYGLLVTFNSRFRQWLQVQ